MPMNPRLLVPRATLDPDAAAYLRAVEAADGQALETPVKRAVDDFFKGCRADGTFGALKAACLLCGARTLAGALVPLVGTAPTNVADGFVEGDYSRTAGLTGDGTSYLDSGRASDDDPDDNAHFSVYASTLQSTGVNEFPRLIGVRDTIVTSDATNVYIAQNNGSLRCTARSNDITTPSSVGFIAASRNGLVVSARSAAATTSVESAATDASSLNHYVFAYNVNGSAGRLTTSTLAFYSIGTAISDLALLDTRVTTLITAIGNAL